MSLHQLGVIELMAVPIVWLVFSVAMLVTSWAEPRGRMNDPHIELLEAWRPLLKERMRWYATQRAKREEAG